MYDEIVPDKNTRFLGVTKMGKDLFAYQLYIKKELAKTIVLDETLSPAEAETFRLTQVELHYTPYRVYQRSLAYLESCRKGSQLSLI